MRESKTVDRRKFLKTSITGACSAGIFYNQNNNLHAQTDDKQRNIKINEYRTLGRTGFNVSDIGFGAGFLNDPSVLGRAITLGINYIDTGEHYLNGQSERAIGEVIHKHDRSSLFITTKLNISRGKQTKETIKSRFYNCLDRMKTDYADCLMIHMTPDVEQVKHEGFHAAFKELKSDGKVRFLGLSNHGKEQSIYGFTPVRMEDVILAAVEDGRFDVALFVYNFLQKEQGEKIIAECKKKNVGVTLMKTNPIIVYRRRQESIEMVKRRGRRVSDSLIKLMDEYKSRLEKVDAFKKKHNLTTNEQIRDAAIRFTLAHPDVHSVCPTITNFDELNAFIALSGEKITDSDSSTLSYYEKTLGNYYCRHACGLCESACPNKVPVNTIMRYNHYFEAQGREKHAMSKYSNLSSSNASMCLDCSGYCVKECPYNVPIQGLLLYAHNNLTIA